MIEELSPVGWSNCLHCGRAITRWRGEWSAPFWTHDETGKAECPESKYATPWGGD